MSSSTTESAVIIRPLAPGDLDTVVAIDAYNRGRTRRDYVERRLQAARREPQLHAQFAADDAEGLAGFALARVLAGEFGRTQPGLRIELVGVREGLRRSGIGRRLFETLVSWAQRHGVGEMRTAAVWRDTHMLAWFDALGFELAPDVVVECAVDGGVYRAERDDPVAIEAGEGPGHEIDYGRPEGNDHERLARDRADVSSMTADDLEAITRIDCHLTGHERREYIGARLAEALEDSAIRVSLTARSDDAVVGYLMARADLGDFGRTEPVAVIDTLGVDPAYEHHGIGHALLSQLFANLGALRVERVETVVPQRNLALLGFLHSAGFVPSQQLPFVRQVETAP